MNATQPSGHRAIVLQSQSFLSDQEPWYEGFCSCGWHADATTEQGVWDAFRDHEAAGHFGSEAA